MSILMAVLGSVLTAASFWLLVTNVSGACSGVLGLVACVGIVVCSVVAAQGWYNLLAGKIPARKK